MELSRWRIIRVEEKGGVDEPGILLTEVLFICQSCFARRSGRIGLNANLREFPEELEDKATSLQKEIGHKVNRSALIAECMEKIEENYEIFVKTQDLSGLMAAYQEALVNQDQQVRVLEPGHEYTGVARGINAMGELLVEKEDGTITEVYAGEVSVRGLYGYV